MITVNLVRENIKNSNHFKEITQSDLYIHCHNCQSILNPNIKKSQNDKLLLKHCDIKNCLTQSEHLDDLTNAAYFYCPQCQTNQNKQFEVCAACYTRYFVRMSLAQKNEKHTYYKSYNFQNPDTQRENSNEGNQENNIYNKQDFGKANLMIESESQTARLYVLIGLWQERQIIIPSEQNSNYNQSAQQSQSSLDSFDQKGQNRSFICNKQFRVDNPIVFSRGGTLELSDFLIQSDDHLQFFYFNRQSDGEICINLIDIDNFATHDKNNELHENSIYQMPLQQDPILLNVQAKTLIEDFIVRNNKKPSSLPRLYKDTICFKGFEGKNNQTQVLNFFNWQTWVHLFKLEANLLIKFQNNFQSIWYILKSKIYHVEWPKNKDQKPTTINQYEIPQSKDHFKLAEREVNAYLHFQETRLTIVVTDDNWYTYQINGKEIKEIFIKHELEKSAQVIHDFEQDTLYLAGRMVPTQSIKIKYQGQYQIGVVNLNEVKHESINYEIGASYNFKLHFQAVTELYNFENEKMKLMPFVMVAGPKFYSQLFYQDPISGFTNVMFISASKEPVSIAAAKNLFNPWIIQSFKNHAIDYPILIHLSPNPKQDTLIVCNLAKNNFQSKLYLKDITFIQFLEGGHHNDPSTASQNNIYFLGFSQTTLQLNIYQVIVKPWSNLEDEIFLQRVMTNISIGKFQYDQIKCIQLIQESLNRLQMIIQLQNTVIAVTSNVQGYQELLKNDQDISMAPIFLLRGLWNLVYFVRRSIREGDEIVCCQYNVTSKEFDVKTVYQSKPQILQISMDNDLIPSKLEKKGANLNQMILIDQNLQMTVLKNTDEQSKTIDSSMQVSGSARDLSYLKIKRLFRCLEQTSWQKCLISTKAVICARTIVKNSKNNKKIISREQTIYSLNTINFKKIDFLGYDSIKSDSNACLDISNIKYTAKIVSIMKEDEFCYFMTSQNPTSQRIDLMSYFQQRLLGYNIYVMKQIILMASDITNQYIVIDQKHFLIKSIKNGKVKIEDDAPEDFKLVEILNEKKEKLMIQFDENGNEKVLWERMKLIQTTSTLLKPKIDHVAQTLQASLSFLNLAFWNQKAIVSIEMKSTIAQSQSKKIKVHELVLNKLKISEKKAEEDSWQHTIQIVSIQENDIEILFFNNDTEGNNLKTTFQISITNNFIVLGNRSKIWIVERKNIKQFNENQKQIMHYNVPITKILLDQMFDSNITFETGFRFVQVSKSDLNFLRNNIKNKNLDPKLKKLNQYNVQDAIQISFKDQAIVWDLQKNAEIQTIYSISNFDDVETYTRTGFKIHYLDVESQMRTCKFRYQNENSTLISFPECQDKISALFRLYTANQIYEMMKIQQIVEQEGGGDMVKLQNLSPDLFTINIYGDSFFSIFYKQADVLELAYKQILELDLDDQNETDQNIYIRKLFYTICLPYRKRETHTIYNKNVSLKAIQQEEPNENKALDSLKNSKYPMMSILYQTHIKNCKLIAHTKRKQRDILKNKHSLTQFLIQTDDTVFEKMIQLLLLSNELTIRTLIQRFQDFKDVFFVQSEMINEFMIKAFIQTPMTRRVTSIRWNNKHKIIVFPANTAQISANQIENHIKDQIWSKHSIFWKTKSYWQNQKDRFRPVEVRVIEVMWLNKNIDKFYRYLTKQPAGLFDNELIKVLLQQQDYTYQIAMIAFVPFLIYFVCCMYYFLFQIPQGKTGPDFSDPDQWRAALARILIFIDTFYLISLEIKQISFSKYEYIFDLYNYLNWLSLLLNLSIVIQHSYENEFQTYLSLANMTSVGTIILWCQLYYWMRLLPYTGFYVKLIQQTLIDIGYFLLYFAIIIFAFSCQQLLVDRYNEHLITDAKISYTPLSDPFTQNIFTDALINQYNVVIGQFSYFQFAENNQSTFVWIFFILSSFLTNIVFLNMLIAVMGDTFAKITEKKERNGLIQTTQMYSDFIKSIKKDPKIDNNRYLYIVTPVIHEENGDNDNWEGGYNKIAKKLDQFQQESKLSVKKSSRATRQEFFSIRKAFSAIREQQKKLISTIETMNEISQQEKNLEQTQKSLSSSVFKKKSPKVLSPGAADNLNLLSTKMYQNQRYNLKGQNMNEVFSGAISLENDSNQIVQSQIQQTQAIKSLFSEMHKKLDQQITPRLDKMQGQIFKQEDMMKELQKNLSTVIQTYESSVLNQNVNKSEQKKEVQAPINQVRDLDVKDLDQQTENKEN